MFRVFFIENYQFCAYDLSFIVCATYLLTVRSPQPLVKFNLNVWAVTGTRCNHYLINLWKYFVADYIH